MNVLCPRCNKGVFNLPPNTVSPEWTGCNYMCGMFYSYRSNDYKYVGEHMIFWYWDGKCVLWTLEWRYLYSGDYLPWDITDSEIRIRLVFQ